MQALPTVMPMKFSTLPAWTKLAAGVAGAFAVVGGTVVVTAAVTGSNAAQTGPQLLAPTATPYSPAPATGSPAATPNPAARAVVLAVLEAEAQVLGIQPKELRADGVSSRYAPANRGPRSALPAASLSADRDQAASGTGR